MTKHTLMGQMGRRAFLASRVRKREHGPVIPIKTPLVSFLIPIENFIFNMLEGSPEPAPYHQDNPFYPRPLERRVVNER
jgi:hypothetical protein